MTNGVQMTTHAHIALPDVSFYRQYSFVTELTREEGMCAACLCVCVGGEGKTSKERARAHIAYSRPTDWNSTPKSGIDFSLIRAVSVLYSY